MTQKADQTPATDVPPAWRKTESSWPFGLRLTLLLGIVVAVASRWLGGLIDWISELTFSVLSISSPMGQLIIGWGIVIVIVLCYGFGALLGLGFRYLNRRIG